jgi:hypothetical protein
MRSFISYNTSDKILAGKIKQSLEQFGFSTFLAHDDIKPTQAWVERILDELNKSDVFLPLLTSSFHKSIWTLQEVGIAIGQGIYVIPLKVNTNPVGFLGQFQALKIRSTNLKKSAVEIAHVVSKNPNLRRQFLNDLIKMYEASSSFDEAIDGLHQLNLFEGYTSSQVNAVIKAGLDSNQIYRFWDPERELDKFVQSNKKVANVYLVRAHLFRKSNSNAG